MHSLIITAISIALMASALYYNINYVNSDRYDKMVFESVLTTDFYNYETSINSYKKTFNVYPDNLDWETELKKTKLLLPQNSDNKYLYEYNKTNRTVSICFKDIIQKSDYEYIESFHSKGLTVLANDCFKTVDEIIDTTPNSFTVALTIWIKD